MLIRTGMGAQLSGSVGGVTAGHNRFGQYLRNRSIPTNPNTPAQSAARSNLTAANAAWAALSASQRAGWDTYAENSPWTNKFGETVYLTGHQQYVRYFCFLAHVGNPTTPTNRPLLNGSAPGFVYPAISTGVTQDLDGGGLIGVTDNLTTQTGLVDNTLYIDYEFAFPGQVYTGVQGLAVWGFVTNGTVNFHKSPMKAIAVHTQAPGSQIEAYDLEPIFGPLSSGDRLHVQIRYREVATELRLSLLANTYVDALTYTD